MNFYLKWTLICAAVYVVGNFWMNDGKWRFIALLIFVATVPALQGCWTVTPIPLDSEGSECVDDGEQVVCVEYKTPPSVDTKKSKSHGNRGKAAELEFTE